LVLIILLSTCCFCPSNQGQLQHCCFFGKQKASCFSLLTKGSYNQIRNNDNTFIVVFTLQTEGGYNSGKKSTWHNHVVFTLQIKSSYNEQTLF